MSEVVVKKEKFKVVDFTIGKFDWDDVSIEVGKEKSIYSIGVKKGQSLLNDNLIGKFINIEYTGELTDFPVMFNVIEKIEVVK